jgi:hypothetical protein
MNERQSVKHVYRLCKSAEYLNKVANTLNAPTRRGGSPFILFLGFFPTTLLTDG